MLYKGGATLVFGKPISPVASIFAAILLFYGTSLAFAQSGLERFVGDYSGRAEVETYDGTLAQRDMSVSIKKTREGFSVRWSSTTYRDGKGKEKSYEIGFVPSDRDDVYAAAMTKNVFGHAVPLDPMKGEPYVWARIKNDTLTVFSLFVNSDGSYEMQQFDRTLVEDGLQLEFQRLSNGVPQRSISTFLKRE